MIIPCSIPWDHQVLPLLVDPSSLHAMEETFLVEMVALIPV